MNIYAFIPLIATLAYIPLIITTISTRPWRTQHKLFLVFFVTASCWSLADVIFRNDYFPEQRKLLVQMLVLLLFLAAVQFHVFTSSFFPQGKGRWLPFAYGSLVIILIPIALGYLPKSVTADGNKLLPNYGLWIFLIALPLIILLARNLFVFLPSIKNQENPVKRSQYVSLVLCMGVLAFFLVAAIFPFAKEFPISHIGNIFIAVILSYAVVGHQLVDIRFVLRNSFIWFSISIIGIAAFLVMLVISHELLNVQFTLGTMFAASIAGIISVVLVYRLRDLVTRFLGKALQGESYYYREKLFEFANKIHNVFSLKEQGSELLALLTRLVRLQ